MDPIIIVISLFILGILFAIIASLVGIGGGLLYTPTLVLVYSLNATDATYVSSFVIVFTSISGSVNYFKQNRIDVRTAVRYLLVAVPGTFIGGYIAEIIDPSVLRRAFAVIIGIYAIRGVYNAYKTKEADMYSPMNIKDDTRTEEEIAKLKKNSSFRRLIDPQGDIYEYIVNIKWGFIFAFIAGFLAGLLGIGGGIVLVPLLNIISGVPIHVSVATSTFMIVILSISAVISRTSTRLAEGTFDVEYIVQYGIPLAAGAIIGAYFGASKVKKFKARQLTLFFWIVAIIAAVRMYLK